MWAHYAKDHTGIAVEILVDRKNPSRTLALANNPAIHSDYGFYDVKYVDLNKRIYRNNAEPRHNYIVKDKTWSYESESRFIIPFTSINKIIATDEGVSLIEQALGKSIGKAKNASYKVTDAQLSMLLALDTEKLSTIFSTAKNNSVMFFTQIAGGTPGMGHGSIGRIIAGKNADLKRLDIILRKFNSYIAERYCHPISGSIDNVYIARWDRETLTFEEKPFNGYQSVEVMGKG